MSDFFRCVHDDVLSANGSLTLDDAMRGLQMLRDEPPRHVDLSKLDHMTLTALGFTEDQIKHIYEERPKP